MTETPDFTAGRWFVRKWQQRLTDTEGQYHAVAAQMRKQGVPLHIAQAVLLGRSLSELEKQSTEIKLEPLGIKP